MHYADIHALLVKKNVTISQVAESEGVSHSFVCAVIRNKKRSFAVASFIAAAVGKSMNKLWPKQYDYIPRERWRERNHGEIAA